MKKAMLAVFVVMVFLAMAAFADAAIIKVKPEFDTHRHFLGPQ